MYINDEKHKTRSLLQVPFSRSYWIIPGLFLAGEYPGSSKPLKAKEKLSRLLDVGIGKIINLMEPDETDHSGKVFTGYGNVIQTIGKKKNIRVTIKRFSVRDRGIPDISRMTEILDEIDAAIYKGTPAYVHCWGGIGRTGTVVGCFLVRHGLASDENVLEKIRCLRINEQKYYRKSPETREQEYFVRHWKLRESGKPSRLNRYVGCMLGGAVGDALGAPVEFMYIERIRNIYGLNGITDYDRAFGKIGAITDDTQMALFTAEGLLRSWTRGNLRGICHPPSMVHLAYKRWFETQQIHFRNNTNEEDKSFLMEFPGLFSRRAPGNSCLSALQNNRTGTTDNPINNSKGCGTVMRIAPVGLMIDDPQESFKLGCEIGALTHGHPSGYLASGVLAAMISNIKAGADVMESLQTALEILKDYPNNPECLEAVEKAIHLAEHSELTPENIETLGGGWVAEEALAISIFCALKSESDFSEGVFAAGNHTGDSDSTGAITGNILGCRLGASAVPAKWTDPLELHDLIQTIAVDLFIKFRDDDDWWIRYPGY